MNGAKYGELPSREKSHCFSPEKHWSKFYGANHREILDKHALANVASRGQFLETLRADRQVSSFVGDRPHYVVTSPVVHCLLCSILLRHRVKWNIPDELANEPATS